MSKRKAKRGVQAEILSHWYQLIDHLRFSTLQFYERLEQVLIERRVPNLDFGRVELREGGIFSAKRQYLRFIRNGILFDVCAAPFGCGFFVSWRLGDPLSGLAWLEALILRTPIVGGIYESLVGRRDTYYRVDLALMYEEAVHRAVLQVVDELTASQKLPRLSDEERRPIHRDFYKR